MKKKRPKVQTKRYWANEQIRFNRIKLIDENGQFVGDTDTYSALAKAKSLELDLVVLDPSQQPPIAKIIDLGKFLYEQKRKERKNRANAKETELKEIRLSFNMSVHDREVRVKRAQEFMKEGHKVKLHLRLKGRENVYFQKAYGVLAEFAEQLNATFENQPQRQGQVLQTILKLKTDETKNQQSNS